jgi:uncharacterized membrane protein
MTQAEIETKLESLSEQLSQLHKQQENRTKIWLLIGTLSLLVGIGYMVIGLIGLLVLAGSLFGIAVMLTATPLIFLSLALFGGANRFAVTEAASVAR